MFNQILQWNIYYKYILKQMKHQSHTLLSCQFMIGEILLSYRFFSYIYYAPITI